MSDINTLKEKLIGLQGKIETIKAIERERGENFNLFSILRMERLEVKTHSALIYEIINPKGSHNQGNLYLKPFINKVLKIDNFDYENVLVKREDSYADDGRIDFTIENKDIFIAIEMKIDASDQKGQIERYNNISKRKRPTSKVYYLTLDGRDASEKSIGSKDKDEAKEEKEYTNISFSSNILDWIKLCIEKSASFPIIRESLVQYANLIKKLTEQTSEEITMEVINMIDNSKMAEAATKMAQNIGLAWATREAMFWHKFNDLLKPELQKIDWDLLIGEEYGEIFLDSDDEWKNIGEISEGINTQRKKKNSDIGLAFSKKIDSNDITLWLYQYNNDAKLLYQLDEIENISHDKFIGLTKQLDLILKNRENQYGPSKIAVNFYGYGISDSEPTYDLFDDEKLDQFVKETKNEVLDKLNKIDKYFKSKKDS